jgi:DNA repair exonuclease SbcCD nuclease subunit
LKVFFYTDPHIGLNNTANVTQTSLQRLKQAHSKNLNDLLTEYKPESSLAFCLGDLFDQYSNSEAVIQEASSIMQHTDIVLAGNHDISNRRDRLSSLELLQEFYGDRIMVGTWGEPSVFQLTVGSTLFVFVPHVSNQELFEKALTEAASLTTGSGKYNVLCLHCNYDLGFEDLQDTTLNLTNDRAKELLSNFHHVFMGHEHAPAEYFSGRLTVIGNTYPTSFADISNKRILVYDTETGQYESLPTVSGEMLLWQGKLSELPEPVTASFLDLEDDLPRGDAFKAVGKLFKLPTIFAIRLASPGQGERDPLVPSIESMELLTEVVGKDLKEKRPELVPLWEELLAEAENS